MEEKRYHRIHTAASIVTPLVLLVSISYTLLYRAVGLFGRYLAPISVVVFFAAGYFMQALQARLFGLSRTDHDIDDDGDDRVHHYIRKRYLILPTLISIIPAAFVVPLVDGEIRRLVEIGELEYYSDNYAAPWLFFAVIIVSTAFGAAAWLQPGNIAVSRSSVWFYVICHAGLYIIDLFMEIPSILPCLMLVIFGVVALYEINLSFVEDIARKTGDSDGFPKLRETNYQYVKRIVRNFVRVFIVPFLLCAAADILLQYALERFINQPL